MDSMFYGTDAFNSPLDTHTVTRPDGTRYEAWDVSNVTSMYDIFMGTTRMLNNYPNLPRDGDIRREKWDNKTFMEIWRLVFQKNNRKSGCRL